MESAEQRGDAIEATFDRIPIGVIRIDCRRTITYANQAMERMSGFADLIGNDLLSYMGSDDSRSRLERELKLRFEGEQGSEYEIDFIHSDNGRRIPVAVTAAPEFGEDGRVIGSLAFVRDLRLERAHQAIHRAIESEEGPDALLLRFAEAISDVLPFDRVRVTMISENRKHLMGIFEHPKLTEFNNEFKWWPMPPRVLEYIKRREAHDLDLNSWFKAAYEDGGDEPDENTKRYMKLGFRHVLVRPIFLEERAVAFVALETRNERGYDQEQVRIIEQLPVTEVVANVLKARKQADLQFTIDLIRRMGSASHSLKKVADVLVDSLQSYYQWEHVSIFQVDEDAQQLRLLAQGAAGQFRLNDRYCQPLERGLLGLAYTSGVPVNVGDVEEPDIKRRYVEGIGSTRSELCIPITAGVEGRVRWILNVEASHVNSFADAEQESVEILTREAAHILERVALLELKAAILASIKDAVLQTDRQGRILAANPAAAGLLGMPCSELIGRSFIDFIKEAESYGRALLEADSPPVEISVARAPDATVPVLLSTSSLPGTVGGKVFVASDLTFQKRVEETEVLKEVFRQVATEIRTPLALVSNWIKKAESDPGSSESFLNKSAKQLRKMDLTLERVMRVASTVKNPESERSVIDVGSLVGELLDQLPEAESSVVRSQIDGELPPVVAARDDLEFCVGNIVGVMLRSRAQNDTITVSARHPDPRTLMLEMRTARQSAPDDANLAGGSWRQEMTVGDDVVKAAIERMGGTLDKTPCGYAIGLPLAVEGELPWAHGR
jgi:PAS domain S-box-containing protein